jgi:hypothetical protein
MGLVAPVCRPELMGDVMIERPTKLNGTLQLKIEDEKGQIIPYASIETGVIGKGGAADKNGLFKLDKSILDLNEKIFVSAGGYERKEVAVKLFSNLTGVYEVVLQRKGWLNEVVVTALNPQRQEKFLTGHIVRVTAEQLQPQEIKGKVVDENNNPVPFATVQIKGTFTAVAADEKGLFTIKPALDSGAITLVATSISFNPAEVIISKRSFSDTAIIMMGTERRMMVGELVITRPVKKQIKNIPLIPANSNNNTASAFKVFPNPVDAGTNLNIEWLQKEEGYYTLQLLGESGQSVYQQEIWIDAEARLLSINVPEVAPGNYFVVLTNKNTRKTFSEKIVIQ